MKKFIVEFLRRGAAACGLGPIVLAILYLVLHRTGSIDYLSVNQVSMGIFSLTALAFVAGGMNAIYQIEQLPLMVAILIHGVVLYVSYLAAYLINNWLAWDAVPVLVFTAIFIGAYLLIWAVIYAIIKRNTAILNESLKKRRQPPKDI